MRRLTLLLALIPTTLEMAQQLTCARPPKIVKIVKTDPVQEKCLAVTIFGEARGESEKGQIAVAHTILNRARKSTICSVALAPKQYSIFNNNPFLQQVATSLYLEPIQQNIIDTNSWKLALKIANNVLTKKSVDITHGSTHYIAYKSLKHIPKWTHKLTRTVQIGNHTFFKV